MHVHEGLLEQFGDTGVMAVVRRMRPVLGAATERLNGPSGRLGGDPVVRHELDLPIEHGRQPRSSRVTGRVVGQGEVVPLPTGELEFAAAEIDTHQHGFQIFARDVDRASPGTASQPTSARLRSMPSAVERPMSRLLGAHAT